MVVRTPRRLFQFVVSPNSTGGSGFLVVLTAVLGLLALLLEESLTIGVLGLQLQISLAVDSFVDQLLKVGHTSGLLGVHRFKRKDELSVVLVKRSNFFNWFDNLESFDYGGSFDFFGFGCFLVNTLAVDFIIRYVVEFNYFIYNTNVLRNASESSKEGEREGEKKGEKKRGRGKKITCQKRGM